MFIPGEQSAHLRLKTGDLSVIKTIIRKVNRRTDITFAEIQKPFIQYIVLPLDMHNI